MTASLLSLDSVSVEFRRRGRPSVRAVDDVTFTVAENETVGLIGESGSGKTTIGNTILGLTAVAQGEIMFDGVSITKIGYGERRRLSADLQVVFQDPYGSLNPTRSIGQTLAEPLLVTGKLTRSEVRDRVAWMLDRVGLPGEAAESYPGRFSGGQRQRIAIGRALMVRPKFVVCDEPVSALDLSVQAQILNLLRELQEELRVSYLFIAHDLSVVRHLSHRTIVLYRGQIMEEGAAGVIHGSPLHPYTRALLEASPVPDPAVARARSTKRPVTIVRGGFEHAQGCPYVARCPLAIERCGETRPALDLTPLGSRVACHRWRDVLDGSAVA